MINNKRHLGELVDNQWVDSIHYTIIKQELMASFERGWAFEKIVENREPTQEEREWYWADLKSHHQKYIDIDSMVGNEHLDALCHHYEIYLDKNINRYVMVINGGEYIYYPLSSGRKLYKVTK